jgi:hypothetical protein
MVQTVYLKRLLVRVYLTRCPWLKPLYCQAAFRGVKAPAPSGKRDKGGEQTRAREGDFVAERVEGLRRCERYRGSFDFAQDRLFALERRAQDDSKSRQRQEQRQRPIQRFWLRQNDDA